MWSRAQLKEKAKYTFKLNYWKIVLITLLAGMISTGVAAGSGFSANFSKSFENVFDKQKENYLYQDYEYYYGNEDFYDWGFDVDDDIFFDNNMGGLGLEDIGTMIVAFAVIFFVIFMIIFVIALAISLVWAAFVGNPVEVGAKRFFYKSLNEKAEAKEVMFAVDHSYKNVMKVMFFRTLYTMLWSLLFVIPGIVKGYEYRMIPYLLAENPNLTKEQAFAISKQMMMGQKWDTFVLDLSFIGWYILSAFTAGILALFYVNPYKNMTDAALYEELSRAYGHPALGTPNVYQTENPYMQQET